MYKLLFIILTLGFVIQCSGLARQLYKSVVKMEQCGYDTSPGEENKHDELKIDDEQIGVNIIPVLTSECLFQAVVTFNEYFPTEFSAKPYLPPGFMHNNRAFVTTRMILFNLKT